MISACVSSRTFPGKGTPLMKYLCKVNLFAGKSVHYLQTEMLIDVTPLPAGAYQIILNGNRLMTKTLVIME